MRVHIDRSTERFHVETLHLNFSVSSGCWSELRPGIVIMENLGSHKGTAARGDLRESSGKYNGKAIDLADSRKA